MKNFINFLPPWVETNIQPAFYDKESGACLQQTARMYAKVNQLVRIANEQYATIQEYINKFIELKEYVEDYFDNLDVQEEINNKLDAMVEDGTFAQIVSPLLNAFRSEINGELDSFQTNVQTQIDSIDNKVTSAVSGNPIPVADTSDMTDHDRTYLLTSDGYWYYWDGDSWERGGVYQSTDISDLSIGAEKTKFAKRSDNLIDIVNVDILTAYPGTGNTMSSTPNVRSLYIECSPNTTYIITRSVSTGRFGVCDSAVTPTTSSAYSNLTQNNTSTYITHTTGATAEYLIVYYWNNNYSSNTPEEALEDLCVLTGSENRGVIPSYIVEVKTDNINNSAVTPVKTSFSKNSSNLFDKNNANLVNLAPSEGTLYYGSKVKSIFIPCDPSSNYVIKKRTSARFNVCGTASTPADTVAYTNLVANNAGEQIKYTTSATSNYLVVYLYNQNQDTLTVQQIIDSLVIVKGSDSVGDYIPYGKIIEVSTDNLNDKSVTPAKLSDELRSSIMKSGSLASRNGIYGVEWDVTAQSSACTRIGDAVGLKNDYMVEDTYQINGGTNDFDNIFPWCDIRRCNVTVSSDGNKSITYEGETGFTLDGSNGNVMVEIPKFYSMRERIGNTERIAISGESKSGFNVEPAFLVDGKEQDFIYVACYHQSSSNNGVYSYTGSYPTTNQTISQNITTLTSSNLQSYDFTTFLMLQKLMIIEFANRSVQQYLGGMTRLPYWTANTTNVIDGYGENYITFQEDVGQGTMKAFWVGERIRVGDTSGGEQSTAHIRTITAITKTGSTYKVEYDGEDMSSELNIGDGVGCVAQKNGWCDDMTYHTGRRAFATDTTISNYVSPMRYRYIENVIGNVWEQLAGIRVKGLTVHYSFEPNFNEAFSNTGYKTLGYAIPLQNQYPSSNQGWILKDGYDVNNRLINLPIDCGSTGGQARYMGGTFYSKDVTGVEYEGVCGGGYDTYYWANINTIRLWEVVGTKTNLYGNRPVVRG